MAISMTSKYLLKTLGLDKGNPIIEFYAKAQINITVYMRKLIFFSLIIKPIIIK